jgi:hypothetical protein
MFPERELLLPSEEYCSDEPGKGRAGMLDRKGCHCQAALHVVSMSSTTVKTVVT